MKYIDAERLKAEIERRLKDYWEISFHDVKAYGEDSNVRELKELLIFIASLQQEQPEVDIDIKQELYHHFGQVKDFTLGVDIASYFYELGRLSNK